MTIPASVGAPAATDGGAGVRRFDSIDGLRAIAAIAVVVYHTVINYNERSLEFATWEWINRLGNFGVSTFFVISGVLLYRPFVLSHFRGDAPPRVNSYLTRRFLRILPGYWLALTVAIVALGATKVRLITGAGDYFSSYLLMQNYRRGHLLTGIGVEWTLVIELSFYLALPVFANWLRHRDPGATIQAKLRRQLLGLLAMYVVAMATRVWALWFNKPTKGRYGDWFPFDQITSWLPAYLDWFAFGMLLAVGSAWLAMGHQLPWVAQMLADNAWASWLIALQTYWVALQLHLPVSVFTKVTRIQSFGIAFTYGIVAFFLLLPAVFGQPDRGLIRRVLRSRVMHGLGTISFGIYLFHLIAVEQVVRWTQEDSLALDVFVWLAVVLAITLPAATLSYFLVEKPLIKLSHRLTKASRVAVANNNLRDPAARGPNWLTRMIAPSEDGRRPNLRAFLELFALCGLVIAQPLLDLLGKNVGLFVTSDASALEVVLLALLVVLIPPLVLWCVEMLVAAFMPKARHYLHLCAMALLAGVFAVELLKQQTELSPTALIWIGVLFGIGAGVFIVPRRLVKQFLRYLAFAPPVYLVLFLVASPVTDVAFGGDGSVSSASVRSPKRIVFLQLDEFPVSSLLDGNGRIDQELFPNFAKLADESNWYRNTTTVSPYTSLAVPAILTGKYPYKEKAAPSVGDYPDNLFTLLGNDYKLNVHEAVTRLCPERLCESQQSGSGLSSLISNSVKLWQDFAAPKRTSFAFNTGDAALASMRTYRKFLTSIKPGGDRVLDWVHVELPHQPWHYNKDLQDSEAVGDIPGAKYLEWSDATSAEHAYRRYLIQLQAVDTLVGQTVDKMKRVGAYDETLFVVTADHGVAFQDKEPLRSVSNKNYADVMWVPLFVKLPGQTQGLVDDRPALTIDILPTIADAIDAKIPNKIDGQSLLAATKRPEGQRRMYQWGAYALEIDRFLKAPEGKGFLEFDGAAGFATAIAKKAVSASGDPDLRIYRSIEFGELVGQDAAAMISDEPGDAIVTIAEPQKWQNIDPKAPSIPWAYGGGIINNLNGSRPVAIVLNGKIIAVSRVTKFADRNDGIFIMNVPPKLATAGSELPQVYFINGTVASPSLDPIPSNTK